MELTLKSDDFLLINGRLFCNSKQVETSAANHSKIVPSRRCTSYAAPYAPRSSPDHAPPHLQSSSFFNTNLSIFNRKFIISDAKSIILNKEFTHCRGLSGRAHAAPTPRNRFHRIGNGRFSTAAPHLFNAKSTIFNAEFIIYNTKFIIFKCSSRKNPLQELVEMSLFAG